MRAVLVISERDNVATALEALEPGRRIELTDGTLVAIDAVPPGHKIALRPVPSGTAVFKYGSAIGIATRDIPAGAHVHTHNVASSRGRGDLAPAPQLGSAASPDGRRTVQEH